MLLAEEISANNIPVTLCQEDGKIMLKVPGFSKSGEACVYLDDDNNLTVATRYGRVDIIYGFDDLAFVAFDWFVSYKNREPYLSSRP